MKTLVPFALLALASLASVTACSEPVIEESIREDLDVIRHQTRISNGLSDQITFEVPEGVDSFLIEVRGDVGMYFLAELITPGGRDIIEGGIYQTRGAREVAGLVDWLYPNSPEMKAKPGKYTLTVRGRDARTKKNSNEDIEVLIYLAKKKPSATCGIRLDFLIDDEALDEGSFEAAVEHIVNEINVRYRTIGIEVENYQIYRINMNDNGLDLGDGSATRIVDDVLARAIPSGAARKDAMHILFVRKIGGTNNPTFDPAGYSMGLPGPYARSRDTSAVLVATEKYAGSNGLDADGLASSLAHEMGHYLGLYHTSEPNGTNHDPLPDTPECDAAGSCSVEFRRNLMTSGRWLQGERPSSRINFSDNQGQVMRGHPLCLPMDVRVVKPSIEVCTKSCSIPNTCAVVNQQMSCQPACNPTADKPCETGSCESDELGTYICQ